MVSQVRMSLSCAVHWVERDLGHSHWPFFYSLSPVEDIGKRGCRDRCFPENGSSLSVTKYYSPSTFIGHRNFLFAYVRMQLLTIRKTRGVSIILCESDLPNWLQKMTGNQILEDTWSYCVQLATIQVFCSHCRVVLRTG